MLQKEGGTQKGGGGVPSEKGGSNPEGNYVKYGIPNCYHKKIPHIWRRWGTPQSFCLTFIDELEKQLFKKLSKRAIKNVRILTFTTSYFLKKIKKNTWRYQYFRPVYQTSWWYDLQFLRYRMWQTKIGNFGSFSTLLP